MSSASKPGAQSGNSMIPFIDLKTQYERLQPNIERRISKVLSEAHFILGPEVTELEERLADYCGVAHAISVANGTDALKIALLAEGIGPGDAVFVPSFTFVATAEVVADIGASPVFVDILDDGYGMDLDDLVRRLDQTKRDGALRPRAVIAVDLFGLPVDYDRLEEIAETYGLLLIADAAQSFGATRNGRRVGGLAPVTTTSFYPSKPLGCYGDGGCIFTEDEERASVMRTIARHGFSADGRNTLYVGLNSRLDTVQATILLEKLTVFDEELDARDRIAQDYTARLQNKIVTPRVPQSSTSAWALYSILVEDRTKVMTALADGGISAGIYYGRPLHLQDAYGKYGQGSGSLPVTERVSEKILSIPMHPYLEQETIEYICQTLLETQV